MQLYFDNAATSFPKPDVVLDAVAEYQKLCGASPGRGAYQTANDATETLDQCRELLCKLVNASSAKHCIFTLNCTDALNLAITGIATHFVSMNKPVHIVTSSMDHNSVLRPLHALASLGVTHTIVSADSETGLIDPIKIKNAITPDTRLVAIAHGSNVTGTVQDIETIGAYCKNIPFLVDAAQTMGHTHIDVRTMNIDLLAFPGHKGLLGPLGTGGLIMKPGIEEQVTPIRTGGTGSESEHPIQPMALPDKYEVGSHNMIGIAGLVASLRWILDRGVSSFHETQKSLCEQFINEIKTIRGVRIVGPSTTNHRCSVFSLSFDDEPNEIAKRLEEVSGVCVRAGLHCSPLAHETMGTDTLGGTVRVSFGPFHTSNDIAHLVQAIANATERVLS
jgi:cysteine desulfurase family protein|tara:strand:+ start:2646 stop:3818 length:1173 start_codon:yes stop_codon:yes gene_type:complete